MQVEQGADYTLKIEGAGISLERQINPLTLGRVIRLVFEPSSVELDERLTDLSDSPQDQVLPKKKISLREFLSKAKPNNFPEKITAIGRYLEEHESTDSFSREEIRSRFRGAGEAPPGNFPREFAKTIALGWIAEVHGESGRLYVTNSGQGAVESAFGPTGEQPRRRSVRRSKRGYGGLMKSLSNEGAGSD